MLDSISNSDDVIDSRDVIARIDALRSNLESVHYNETGEGRPEGTEEESFEDWLIKQRDDFESAYQDEAIEYATLCALADEAEGYAADWQYGATLVRESYFVDYCKELVSDIGDMPREIPSYIEIDWEATARNIKVDYTEVDFDGVTYLVR